MNATAAVTDDRRQAAHALLTQLLVQMDLSMRVESKDMDDGGIAVALHLQPPEVEQVGFAQGKRSPVLEALQFFVNKVVNPPTAQRRWVSVAVGEFPPPRGNGQDGRAPAPVAMPAARAPEASAAAPGRNARRGPAGAPGAANVASSNAVPGEKVAPPAGRPELPADPVFAAVGKTLAERSSSLGRFYAVLGLSGDDRTRLMQAAQGVEGVSLASEGEGRNRRLVYRPAKPAPVPKRVPDDDEE